MLRRSTKPTLLKMKDSAHSLHPNQIAVICPRVETYNKLPSCPGGGSGGERGVLPAAAASTAGGPTCSIPDGPWFGSGRLFVPGLLRVSEGGNWPQKRI